MYAHDRRDRPALNATPTCRGVVKVPPPPALLLGQEKIGDVRALPWTKRSSMEEVACHREIAAYVREHVLKLEAVARRDYYGDDPDKSPYSSVARG